MTSILRSLWDWFQQQIPELERACSAETIRARSLQLLEANLSPEQHRDFSRRDYFYVVGGETGRRYRIGTAYTYNVARLDAFGRAEFLLCFGPKGEVPLFDVLLAQKIALELYEAEALAVANKSPPHHIGWEPTLLRSRHW